LIASDLPIPDEAPVMITVLPERPIMIPYPVVHLRENIDLLSGLIVLRQFSAQVSIQASIPIHRDNPKGEKF